MTPAAERRRDRAMTALNHAITQTNLAYIMAKTNCPKSALQYLDKVEVELREARKVLGAVLIGVKA